MRIIKAGNPKRKENPQRQETMKHVRKSTFTVKYESTKRLITHPANRRTQVGEHRGQEKSNNNVIYNKDHFFFFSLPTNDFPFAVKMNQKKTVNDHI